MKSSSTDMLLRMRRFPSCAGWQWIFFFFALIGGTCTAADAEQELKELRNENRWLRQQMEKQQQLIDSLGAKVAAIERSQKISDQTSNERDGSAADSLAQRLAGQTKVNLSGQVAAGFFKSGSEGMFPKGEFRVDEARVFLDAQAWPDVYGFVELNIMTREAYDDGLRIGEAYLDFERVLKWRGLDSLVNIRVGRFYIPFGEEYSARLPMENPLILHSLSDLWGVDEGVEVYGSFGPVQYAAAVQNGNHAAVGDFSSDKSVAGRIAYEPAKWLRLSGSGMRTGDLSATGDQISEMWFADGFFRSLGNPASTTRFHAELAEGDVQFLLSRGHLKFAGGGIHYDDNDRLADHARDVYYYYAEGLLRFTKQFYGAARFSQIFADDGFPILGNGNWPDYFDTRLTENLWRTSLGLGYTPNANLVFKIEYSVERGTTAGGDRRSHEDFLGAQAALRF